MNRCRYCYPIKDTAYANNSCKICARKLPHVEKKGPHDSWLGLAPKSFARLGERVGQGDRCAYLRLARIAELSVPIAGRVHVKPGQKVKAGIDLIGAVPHP